MGQVFKARDTRLNRDVALKVLPDSFATDADRLARFTREAQTLASLNHQHIAAIYGLEESGGVRALVMELVEGEDLSERIARGPIPVDEALPIARQIVDALEAAHEQGIIHRDLKPANIKLRDDGSAKVLDFGLAKVLAPESTAAGASGSLSPTLSLHATLAGVLLGTAAYMSPEQAKGRAVDKRSDIWAFGAVLYEMLTGRKAFDGEDITEIVGAVVKTTPDWSLLPANVPPHIVTLIRRCLEKDRKSRIGDMAVARFLLDSGVDNVISPAAPATTDGSPAWVRAVPWSLAGLFLLAALAVSLLHFRESLPDAPSVQFQIAAPANSTIGMFRLSPDGRQLVFVGRSAGRNQLWVRRLDSITAVPLAGTDGAGYPFWSPDSSEIAFFGQGKLKKIAAAGGPTVNLADTINARGGTWSRDGIILFARDAFGGLYRVTAAGGGTPVAVTTVAASNEGDRFPEFLPDGRRFLFLRNTIKEGGLYVGDLTSSALVRLLPDVTNGAYMPGRPGPSGGFLFFRRDNTLMTQAFDPERLQLSGDVMPIADQVAVAGNVGYGAYAVSPSGTIAFMRGQRGGTRQIVWLDRAGQRLGTVGKPDQISNPALSPDEKSVAFTIGDATAGAAEVWLQNLDTGVLSRFTAGAAASDWPVWSHDGARVAFVSTTSVSDYEIRSLSATAAGGRADVLLRGAYNSVGLSDWSRDGRFILFSSRGERTRDDLWVLPMEGEKKASVLLQTPANERGAVFSPQGDWIAYTSDESGEVEVWVQHFPLNGSKFQISSGGGNFPKWSRAGTELFYRTAGGTMMSVPVTAGATFQRGQARTLFEAGANDNRFYPTSRFQPSADGKRFLAIVLEGETQAPPVIWTNWQATVKK